MKNLLLLGMLSVPLLSIGQITHNTNCIRSGDEIIKQQVEYKDPGRSGQNVIWDFSKLKDLNPEYKLLYFSPELIDESYYVMGKDTIPKDLVNPEDLVIGLEHYTNYYYRVKNNRLHLLGHENPVSQMMNYPSIPVVDYPFSYQQNLNEAYSAMTIYSGTEKMYFDGNVDVSLDAQGMMILPSKDTLRHVSRIKTIQTIIENSDSIEAKLALIPDTIRDEFRRPPLKSTIETHRWYVKGYRYPVFETVRNISQTDSIESDYFTTAFFYPPVDHYYLEDDPENLAVLEDMENEENQDEGFDPEKWLADNFSYNYNPNPVYAGMNIEYYLGDAASVGISLHSSTHGLIKTIPIEMKQPGVYSETIDCSVLSPGTYILRFTVRDQVISNVILKK